MAAVEIASKDFQGDILGLKSIYYFNPETGEYQFDYAEKTPEVMKAIDGIKFWRVKSSKIEDVVKAMNEYQKKVGTSPTTSVVNAGTAKPGGLVAVVSTTPPVTSGNGTTTAPKPPGGNTNSAGNKSAIETNITKLQRNRNEKQTIKEQETPLLKQQNKPANGRNITILKSQAAAVSESEKGQENYLRSNTGSYTPVSVPGAEVSKEEFNAAFQIFKNLKAKNEKTIPLTEQEQKNLTNAEATINAYEKANPNTKGGKRRARKTKKAKKSKKSKSRKH
jgi:hypothetical protein